MDPPESPNTLSFPMSGVPMTPRGRFPLFAPPQPFPILQSSVLTLKDQEIAYLRETLSIRDARVSELENQVRNLSNRVVELEVEVLSASVPALPPTPYTMPLGQSVDLTGVPIATSAGVKTFASPTKGSAIPRLGSFTRPRAVVIGGLNSPKAKRGERDPSVTRTQLRTPRLASADKPLSAVEYQPDVSDSVDTMIATIFRSSGARGRLQRINRGFYRFSPDFGDENVPALPGKGEFDAEITNGVLMVRARGWNNEKRGRLQRLLKDLSTSN